MIANCLHVILVCLGFHAVSARNVRSRTADQLFITISPLEGNPIELNWDYASPLVPDTIALYRTNPIEASTYLAAVKPKGVQVGRHMTNVSFMDTVLPTSWQMDEEPRVVSPGSQCLNLWVAAWTDGRITRSNCLRIQPTWMRDNRDRIGDIPLGQMFIPGTHNSACYDGMSFFKTINNYILNQNQDIWTQLVFGVRYLDVRVGFYNHSINPNAEEFWVNHDAFRVTPLVPVLREVAAFLRRSKDEVVILDIHRFPTGFKVNSVTKHKRLISLIEREVGNISVPNSYQAGKGPTLQDLWKTDKRLIVCYGEKKAITDSKILWDPLKQLWGNQQLLNGLKNYLSNVLPNTKFDNKNPLSAAMAQLTPNTQLVVFGTLSSSWSLPQLADITNTEITKLFRYELGQSCNIVATDFFLGNDIINIAIDSNLLK